MKEYGLRKPEFIDMEIGFRVNLYRKQDVATSQETSQEAFNTSQEINKTNQETNKISQETNQKPYNTGHEMNQDEIPATELTNTDKIRNAIAGNPSVTQKELQELTGLSRSGVRYVLQQMWAAGKLDRIGSTKNGKWILKE